MLYYGFTTVLLFNVTAPMRASNLPSISAPVFMDIDWSAMMLPLKTEVVPRVAEVPTCQKIFFACAPPAKKTLRPEVVFNEEAI
jgi:hypothetical protein